MRRMILPLMLVVAVACQPATVEQQATTAGPDVEAIRALLAQTVTAYNAADVEAAMALYADDVLSMPPTDAAMGKADVRGMMEAFLGENDLQFTAQADEILVAGDVGVLLVSYDENWTPKGEGEPGAQHGKWLIVLRKQADGSWKAWRDMWTSVSPPPQPAM